MSAETVALLKFLIPALFVGGLPGLIALYRQLKKDKEESEDKEREAIAALAKIKMEAEAAAWDRAKSTIEQQAKKMQNQDMAIEELTKELSKERARINILERQMHDLENVVVAKDELIDELVDKNEALSVKNVELEARVKSLENGS